MCALLTPTKDRTKRRFGEENSSVLKYVIITVRNDESRCASARVVGCIQQRVTCGMLRAGRLASRAYGVEARAQPHAFAEAADSEQPEQVAPH